MREGLPARLLALCRRPLVQYGALIAFGVFVWRGRAPDLDLLYAAYGLGPMNYTYKACLPENFARDFPSGVEHMSKSAAMYIYPFAYMVLRIRPEQLMPVVLAVEMVLMAAAMIALTRTLRPQAPVIVSILVVVLVLGSGARDMNFAGFAQPCLWATYYTVADALRILAIVMILRGHPPLAGVLLAGSLMIHPTMGVMGALFVVACFALRPAELCSRRNLAGGALFVVLAGAWVLGVVGTGHGLGGEFPNRLWFDLTRLSSYHWYPIGNGLLTFAHQEVLIPFLSFLVLTGYYLSRSAPLSDVDRKAASGIVGMVVLVTLGLGFSVLPISPTLIKIALHRANDLVLTVGLVYVVAGLWDELESGPAWRQMVAAVILVSPFLSNPGFPLAFSIVLAAPAWLPAEGGRVGRPASVPVAVLVVTSVFLLAFCAQTGILGSYRSSAYTGLNWLVRPAVLIGIVVLSLALLARKRTGRHAALAAVVAALACAAVHRTLAARLGEQARGWCRQYKAAQVWAREKTPEDALFMVDPVIRHPGIGYGWRDYSCRSSFGSLREWVLTSWNYSSDLRLCQEGLKRLAEFGLHPDEYLAFRPPTDGFRKLSADLHRRYYALTDERRLDIARRHRIDYFVSKKLGTAATSKLPVVYENELFIIHSGRPRSDPNEPAR